jgi:hypothetical protein
MNDSADVLRAYVHDAVEARQINPSLEDRAFEALHSWLGTPVPTDLIAFISAALLFSSRGRTSDNALEIMTSARTSYMTEKMSDDLKKMVIKYLDESIKYLHEKSDGLVVDARSIVDQAQRIVSSRSFHSYAGGAP